MNSLLRLSLAVAFVCLASCDTKSTLSAPTIEELIEGSDCSRDQFDKAQQAYDGYRRWVLSSPVPLDIKWQEKLRQMQLTASDHTTRGEDFLAALYKGAARDQFARFMIGPEAATIDGLTETPCSDFVIYEAVGSADKANTEFLKRAAQARDDWWRKSEIGEEASTLIWLIVQHADADLDFQKQALVSMGPLLETGDVSRQNMAYLFDRVAMADDQPQRYGTQGQCDVETNTWEPHEIETPETLDARRNHVGLPPMAEYVTDVSRWCDPKDEHELATD